MSDPGRPKPGPTLDPENWSELRALGHRMLDDVLDQMARLRERPVWTKLPDEVRASFREALPTQATPLDAVYRDFQTRIQPYSAGNTHPRFMGWVQGGGTAIGALAEMLAAGMNANCGGRDHAAIEVERQIARWSAELFGFPETASGIFVTGTSMANFIAVRVACTASLGAASRRAGIAASGQKLTAYVSTAAHGCIRTSRASTSPSAAGRSGARCAAARHPTTVQWPTGSGNTSRSHRPRARTESGFDADEHPMSTQR